MSSKVMNALRKRRCFPVKDAGDDVFVRSLTRGETDKLEKMEGEARVDFIIGCGLVDEAGEPVFPRSEGETESALCERVKAAFADVDSGNIANIVRAIRKVTNPPEMETTVKN